MPRLGAANRQHCWPVISTRNAVIASDAIESINDLPALRRIGWHSDTLPVAEQSGDRLCRVVAQHRASLDVHDGAHSFSAKPIPKLRHALGDASQRPTVGDWVWVRAQADEWHVVELLPRRSVLIRGAAGDRYGRQSLAANVDKVLIVFGADRDFNLRRIERYLTLVAGSGATALLVLTKIDKFEGEQIEQQRQALSQFDDVPQFVVNAKDSASVAPLREQLATGETAVLVGSSGAGKSTLTNQLAGVDLRTGKVRDRDGRGRHTTVTRQLVQLPGGACLIDTPGLREIKFTGEEQAQTALFDDIEELAVQCRFRDCQHESEPGCAVQAAVTAAQLDPARLQSWRKLAVERAERQAQAEEYARRQSRKSASRSR